MGGDSPDKEGTITVTAKGFGGDCLYEGAEITAEALSYKDYIELGSTKETTDSDGEAQFVITGKKAVASGSTIYVYGEIKFSCQKGRKRDREIEIEITVPFTISEDAAPSPVE